MDDHWRLQSSSGFVKEDVIKSKFVELCQHVASWCDEASYHAGECSIGEADLRHLSLELGLDKSLHNGRLQRFTSVIGRAVILRLLSKEVFYSPIADLKACKDLFIAKDEARHLCRLEERLLEEDRCACQRFDALYVSDNQGHGWSTFLGQRPLTNTCGLTLG